eukprot:TRINITY_DN1459_c0_g1_i1.p1 TRINITY_DN1459_c0_g1~~TRINITY_DN1459_c0_g1_i1.p1  ORF type:complete len:344 (+),score=87.39 TRINITY_DN1459_c0_g1_i1:977-2008(+)
MMFCREEMPAKRKWKLCESRCRSVHISSYRSFFPFHFSPLSIFYIRFCLFTMGCDGGTIATRRSLVVRTKKEAAKGSEEEHHLLRWTNCSLSGNPLVAPIVCDDLGNLFNKESVLEAILSKRLPPGFAHLSLRTMHDVELAPITRTSAHHHPGEMASSGSYADAGMLSFMCPVTFEELGKKNGRFVALLPCKHVVAEKCFAELPKGVCPHCGDSVERLIVLNGSEEEVAKQRVEMEEMMGQLEKKRKRKKVKEEKRKKRAEKAESLEKGKEEDEERGEDRREKKHERRESTSPSSGETEKSERTTKKPKVSSILNMSDRVYESLFLKEPRKFVSPTDAFAFRH